jgi:hypothetical protein
MDEYMKYFLVILPLILSLLNTIAYADEHTADIEIFKQSWTAKALALQNTIDEEAPIDLATFIGTHNSYNSQEYAIRFVRYIDPNHVLSIPEQLEMGMRSLEYDIHWTWNTHFKHAALLCHGRDNHVGCSPFDRPAIDGFKELADWLAAHPKEIVLLYIEKHLDGNENKVASDLLKILEPYIFEPTRVNGSAGESCTTLPGTFTKADILKANKQLIIISKGCNNDSQLWNRLVFTGSGDPNQFTFIDATVTDFTSYPDCGLTNIFQNDANHRSMWRIFEDRTELSNVVRKEKPIEAPDLKELIHCDINWIGFDMLAANDERLTAAIWSWAMGFPKDNHGNCAMYFANAGMENMPCNQTANSFVCEEKEAHEFTVLSVAGRFQDGEKFCQTQGKNWHFATPINGKQMSLVNEKMNQAGLMTAWVNYALDANNKWRANQLT